MDSILFYAIPFILAVGFSIVLTPLIKKLAIAWGAIDVQNEPRRIHPKSSIPLLGGWAVIASFLITAGIAWWQGWLIDERIQASQVIVIGIGAIIIALIGILDDKHRLSPSVLMVGSVIVAGIAVFGGIQIGYVTNPFEVGTGPFGLSLFYFTPALAAIFSFLWILGMMYTVKFLDGLDGLVTGVGAIGAIILFVVSLFWDVPLSGTSILALVLAGALIGFLPYHWYPAKIFLGESSQFVGFMLGVISIISGGKIATALLIMGIPILDVVWVIVRRVMVEKHSPFLADRKHLHHRLMDAGLSHPQTVVMLYLFTAVFGVSSIFLQTKEKIIALGGLIVVMIVLGVIMFKHNKKTS